MDVYFVLDTCGQPRREYDLVKWAKWFDRADRSIARTAVAKDVMVLTTFLGVGEVSDPLLFETRVFGGSLDGEELLTRTRADAELTHAELAHWCVIGTAPYYGVHG